MDHVEYKCDGKHSMYGSCSFCDGGLFMCSVCGCAEGATTTECPGVYLASQELDAVYAGALDYRDGKWINAPSGSCLSHPIGP